MKLKQRPEDFQVSESWRFDEDPNGHWYVYLMDKQKLSTFDAVDRICEQFGLQRASVSFCGLKDKQGRTTQLVAVHGQPVDIQDPDLRLKPLGRSKAPLTAANTTSNRFAVTVRDLSEEDVSKLAASVGEVRRLGVVNYFDSQRFGALKHGQGFIVKELMRGDFELALKNLLARPSELDQSGDAQVKAFWKDHWGEWDRKNTLPGAEKYAHVIRWLKKHPDDFRGALLRTEPRWRALQIFAYQSWLWNEGVKQYLRDVVGIVNLVPVLYQAGTLLFPRALDGPQADRLAGTFPLLAPATRFADPMVKKAALQVLEREDMTLDSLSVPNTPEIHFDPEERPLLVFPGRLAVGEAKRDELNRDRLRVNVAFTLPPGAYATLVVKRLFHWCLEPRGASGSRRSDRSRGIEPRGRKAEKAPVVEVVAPAPPTPKKGFLQKRAEEKAARQERRKSANPAAKATPKADAKPAPKRKKV